MSLRERANERVRIWNTKDFQQVITAAQREEIVNLALEDALKLQNKLDTANRILDEFEKESKKISQPQDMNFRLSCEVYCNLRAAIANEQTKG